jgi:putative transposase
MLNQAIAGRAPPVRIITDHDPLFRFHRWLARRVLEVEEIKSVPYAPMSHPFVERLIGVSAVQRTFTSKWVPPAGRTENS